MECNNWASVKEVEDGAWGHEAGEISRGKMIKVFNSMMQGLNIWVSGANEGFQSWDACFSPTTLASSMAEGWEVWE